MTPAEPNSRAWTLLFASLTLSAGHGLFLAFAVTRSDGLPTLNDLGGSRLAPAVLWFLACLAAAPLSLVLRSWLVRLSPRMLGGLAGLACAATLAAFALYLRRIAAG
jgi:hypothetical protein